MNHELLALRKKLEIELKVLISFYKAKENIEELCSATKYNQIAASAIFHSFIINYARPFTTNMVEKNKKFRSPSSWVMETFGKEEHKLHEQIVTIRNKVIAHNDFDYVEASLINQILSIETPAQPPLLRAKRDILIGICANVELISMPVKVRTLQQIKEHTIKLFTAKFDDFSDNYKEYYEQLSKDPRAIETKTTKTSVGTSHSSLTPETLLNLKNELEQHHFTKSTTELFKELGEFYFFKLKVDIRNEKNYLKIDAKIFTEKN